MVKIDAEGTAYNAFCTGADDIETEHVFELFETEEEELPSLPGVHPFAMHLLMQTLKNTTHPDVYQYQVRLSQDVKPPLFRKFAVNATDIYTEVYIELDEIDENEAPCLSITIADGAITNWEVIYIPLGRYMLATDDMLDEYERRFEQTGTVDTEEYHHFYNDYQEWLRGYMTQMQEKGEMESYWELYDELIKLSIALQSTV